MPSTAGLLLTRSEDPSPWLTEPVVGGRGRVELSVTSAVNAVIKAAHLIGDLRPRDGAQVALGLRLPLGWQAVTLVLGAWLAGAGVVITEPGTGLDATAHDGGWLDALVLGPQETDDPPGGELPDAVWGTRLHPFGLAFELAPPFPVEDLAPLLRAQPDRPLADRGRDDAWAARVSGGEVSHRELAARGRALSDGLGETARVLTTLPLSTLDGLAVACVVAVTGGRSLVMVATPSPDDQLAQLCRLEAVTATAGVDVPGLPRLG